MLICKKKSAAAALTTIFFNRIRHLQPAAAFPSPLSLFRAFKAKVFSGLRAHIASAITTRTTIALRTAPLPMRAAGSASGYPFQRATKVCHAFCQAGWLRALRAPQVLSRGQRLHAVKVNEFFPFMALHLFAAAMACVVSGSILVPELFLVS